MRQLFIDIRTRFEAFLAQRDALTLVMRAGIGEYAAALKTVQAIEESDSPHVFAIFPQPFEDPKQYAGALVADFQARHQALTDKLLALGDLAPPPLPGPVLDLNNAPAARLRALFVFARSLIEDVDASWLVVAFLPSSIKNGARYAQLILSVIEHDFPRPWCHHMRFFVREDVACPALENNAKELPRTQWVTLDLGPEHVERALADEANDASLPVPQRMQALMILAGMDTAYQRIEASIEKYTLCARYHHGMRNLPMLALSLNGIGEAYARADRHEPARKHFERALVPATQAKDLPTLTTITLNLANLHKRNENWVLALDHYAALAVLARASLNAVLRLVCHEQAGFCLYKLGLFKRAFDEWGAGVTLAAGIDMPAQQLGFLCRLRDVFAELGMHQQHRDIDHQVRSIEAAQTAETQA
jgi:tetratricopeptide (TPR) repeat protein